MPGMIHVYTGNGNGKTTAALGLALRAYGAGKKILIIQFLKTPNTSEVNAIKKNLPYFTIKCFGSGNFLNKDNIPDKEKELAKNGFETARLAIKSKEYDVLILDELNLAIYFGLIETNEVLELIKNKPEELELIITGRYAPKELAEKSDLVTEMIEHKHYFKKGLDARKGIEY